MNESTGLKTLAHLSDLHMGRNPENDERAAQLCRTLLEARIDHVVISGDITHKGRVRELEAFRAAFAPLLERGRVSLVPGNHDRLGDDLGDAFMSGPRVQTELAPGLFIVRANTTGDHNRSWINGHGAMSEDDVEQIAAALDRAPRNRLVVLLLHHHILPLPDEHMAERLSSLVGLRFTAELERGRILLDRIRGRCDLVLHGHRHMPRGLRVFDDPRPLRVFNAGSSTELGRVCIFTHAQGALATGPWWLDAVAAPPDRDLWPTAVTGLQAVPRALAV